MASPDAHLWKAAMDKEIASMHDQNVWSIVPTPDKNIVGSGWVYRIKKEDGVPTRHKARLVAQGFSQQPGVDFGEVYAPVVRYDSLRLLVLALALYSKWDIMQLDVQAAFLYGILHEEIYMRLPDGYHPANRNIGPVTRNKNLGP